MDAKPTLPATLTTSLDNHTVTVGCTYILNDGRISQREKVMKSSLPRRFSAIHLLIAIVLLIGFSPFAGQLPGGMGIEAVLTSVVLLLAVLAIEEEVRKLHWAALLAVPALVARWIYHFHRELLPHAVYLVGASAFITFVVILLLRFILRASLVNAEVLCAGIVVFLMLGMI